METLQWSVFDWMYFSPPPLENVYFLNFFGFKMLVGWQRRANQASDGPSAKIQMVYNTRQNKSIIAKPNVAQSSFYLDYLVFKIAGSQKSWDWKQIWLIAQSKPQALKAFSTCCNFTDQSIWCIHGCQHHKQEPIYAPETVPWSSDFTLKKKTRETSFWRVCIAV